MGQASGPHRTVARPDDHAPPWDLVVDIVLDVWRTGSYLAGARRSVDLGTLRSAAEQAARVVGVPARVEVSELRPDEGPPLVVMVCFADAGGHAARRARAGLATLLRSVRRPQA